MGDYDFSKNSLWILSNFKPVEFAEGFFINDQIQEVVCQETVLDLEATLRKLTILFYCWSRKVSILFLVEEFFRENDLKKNEF